MPQLCHRILFTNENWQKSFAPQVFSLSFINFKTHTLHLRKLWCTCIKIQMQCAVYVGIQVWHCCPFLDLVTNSLTSSLLPWYLSLHCHNIFLGVSTSSASKTLLTAMSSNDSKEASSSNSSQPTQPPADQDPSAPLGATASGLFLFNFIRNLGCSPVL
jgi:hypothetical protein